MYLNLSEYRIFTNFVLLVIIATSTKAAETIECSTSGTIRSSRLNPQTTYHYTFPDHPGNNTLLMFNVTTARNVKNKRLKYYGDNVALNERKCAVFFRHSNQACEASWKKNYPSCVSNGGFYRRESKAITVTKIKSNQQLVVDYKIVYCDSGRIIPPTESPTTKQELTTASESDQHISHTAKWDGLFRGDSTTALPTTSSSGSSSTAPIQWSLILAVAMSSAALAAMIVFGIVCVCKKRQKCQSEKREKASESAEGDYMEPTPIFQEEGIYAEIDEPYDELGRGRGVTEPPMRGF